MDSIRHRAFVSLGSIALTFLLTLASAAQNPHQGTGTAPPANSSAANDDGWHFGVTPYLWFASANGTIGALGRDASVNASFGDIFSKFNIGLMGVFEARKKRLILNTDFMWLKLSDDSALPINEIGVQSIKAKATQVILTPKVAYRVVDQKKVKLDGTFGIRYWHLSNELTLEPQIANGISDSANWVDVVAGARIQVPLSPKGAGHGVRRRWRWRRELGLPGGRAIRLQVQREVRASGRLAISQCELSTE